MEPSRLHAVPDDAVSETSPLAAARVRRGLKLEEAAARARLDVEDVKCLEEGRIYRFPSVNRALSAALVYATALGISEREARRLAGTPAGRARRWGARRWLAAATALTALAATVWFAVVPDGWRGEERAETLSARTAAKLPSPWQIRVDVYNGTEVANAATALANEIGGPLAYRVGTVENADRLDYVETRVYYPPGSEEIAGRLAGELDVETAALPGAGGRNRLVVIVGRDLAVQGGG